MHLSDCFLVSCGFPTISCNFCKLESRSEGLVKVQCHRLWIKVMVIWYPIIQLALSFFPLENSLERETLGPPHHSPDGFSTSWSFDNFIRRWEWNFKVYHPSLVNSLAPPPFPLLLPPILLRKSWLTSLSWIGGGRVFPLWVATTLKHSYSWKDSRHAQFLLS